MKLLSFQWIVVLLTSNKFLLRNGRTGLYAQPESDYGEGELIYVHHDPYEWVIKAVKGTPGNFQYDLMAILIHNILTLKPDLQEFIHAPTSNSAYRAPDLVLPPM